MFRVTPRGSSMPTFVSNSNNDNYIYGDGNTVTNNNQNINVTFSPRSHGRPNVIIENALGKHHVPGATFESQTDNGCMPGTRVRFLSDVFEILKARSGPHIIWVAGMAGTGKTSIALTLCHMILTDPSFCLGGAFFCSRSAGSVERTDVRYIIPTLAVSLSRQYPVYASILAENLAMDPDAAHRPARIQVETLLKQPLENLVHNGSRTVFIIDALDECSDQGKLADLLDALIDFAADAPIKFLLTSRPEMHIRGSPINQPKHSSVLQLHMIEPAEVTEDIRLYISKTLEQLSPSTSWYTAYDVDALVELSDGLFIFAATVLKYIRGRGTVKGRKERLVKATSAAKASHAAVAPVDNIYEFILTEASRTDSVDEDELLAMRQVLVSILSIRVSVSVEALSELIGVDQEDLRECLDRLHSVVYLPSDNSTPGVRTLHASFGDYLFDRASGDLKITRSHGNDILARGCLQVMAERLRFNISCCGSSYEPNPHTRPRSITISLEYACLQWAYHIASSSQPSEFDETIDKVFRRGFLFWLEILSILGQVRRAAAMLIFAASMVEHSELARFLQDANIFVASSHEAIEMSAAHIYLSALPFTDKASLVHRDFFKHCRGVVTLQALGIDRRGGRLVMSLTGHEGSVDAVAHSPDGHFLASGSRDGTVRIWDMRTGEQTTLPAQKDLCGVRSVAVACDGRRIASGLESGVVQVTDVMTRRESLCLLSGHPAAVLSVIFSPDGRLIASGSADGAIRLWNAVTGDESKLLAGHKRWVKTIAFSPDGKTLASGSGDRTVRLWDVDTGTSTAPPLRTEDLGISCVCFSPDGATVAISTYDGSIQLCAWRAGDVITLFGHSDSVNCISYSKDGYYLVSVSSDRTVRLWALRSRSRDISSIIIGSHSSAINAVSYSPNGLYITTASEDCTIRMWYAGDSRSEPEPLPAHAAGVTSVTVSPDGAFILSGSEDRSIRVWNTETVHQAQQPLIGHEAEVYSVAISSDGRLVASGSPDRTVRLWNARTGRPVGASRSCEYEVEQVSFSPDTELLASGSVDGTVSIWAVANWLPTPFSPLRCVTSDLEQFLRPLQGPVFSFSADGKYLAVGTYEPFVQLWYAGTGQPATPPLRGNMGVILDRQPRSDWLAVLENLPDSSLKTAVSELPESQLRAFFDQLTDEDLHDAGVQLTKRDFNNPRAIPRQMSTHNLSQHDLQSVICWMLESELRDACGRLSSVAAVIAVQPKLGLRAIFAQMSTDGLRVSFSRLNGSLPRRGSNQPSSAYMTADGLPDRWPPRAKVDQRSEDETRDAVSRLPGYDLVTVFNELSQHDLHDIFRNLHFSKLRDIASRWPRSDFYIELRRLSSSTAEFDHTSAVKRLTALEMLRMVPDLTQYELRDALDLLIKSRLYTVVYGEQSPLILAIPQPPISNLRSIFDKLPEYILRHVLAPIDRRTDELLESELCGAVGRLPESELREFFTQLPRPHLSVVVRRLPDAVLHAAFSRYARELLNFLDRLLESRPEMLAILEKLPTYNLRHAIGRLSGSGLRAVIKQLPQSDPSVIPQSWKEGTKSVAFSPDSMKIVSGVKNGTIYVWDLNIRSHVLAMRGHTGSVNSVAWSGDGRMIASGSDDMTVRLWDAENGQLLSTLHGHTKQIRSVVFTSDSRSVVSGSDDGTIRIWDVNEAISPVANDPFDRLCRARRDKGWLIGPEEELLLWVPPEYLDNLVLGKRCRNLIASHRVVLSTDENGLLIGDDWAKCWCGPTTLQ